jgi:hypothetical protein
VYLVVVVVGDPLPLVRVLEVLLVALVALEQTFPLGLQLPLLAQVAATQVAVAVELQALTLQLQAV